MSEEIIQSIEPDGEFFSKAAGCQMYAFVIGFESGLSGQANSKSPNPPYAEGDTVYVDITGEHNGVNKLKVNKNPPQNRPQSGGRPPQRAANSQRGAGAPPGNYRPVQGQQPAQIFGATVGMACNQSMAVTLREYEGAPAAEVGTPNFWKRVWENASSILRIAAVLEKGKLAPNGAQEPVREPAPPPRETRRTAPVNEREAANQDGAVDPEDVPF